MATPIIQPGGDPGILKNAIVLSCSGSNVVGSLCNGGTTPGSTTHINVAGDTNVAVHSVGLAPVHAALTSGGARIFVANRDDGTVSAYTTFGGPGISVTTISLPAAPSKAQPVFVNSRDNSNVYIADQSPNNQVHVISQSTLAVTKSITVGITPVALAELPAGNKVYVANKGSGNVTVINTADFSTNPTPIAVGGSPSWIDVSSDGNCVYVANNSASAPSVSVISTSTDTVTATLTVGAGPTFLRFDPRLQRVYVANTSGNSVSIINHSAACTPLQTDVTTVGVGTSPTSVTALADGSRAYVANSGSNTVSVINTSSNALKVFPNGANGITVGAGPVSVDSSSDSTRVYVANSGSGNISIIKTVNDAELTDSSGNIIRPAVPPASPNPTFVLVTP